MRLGAGIALALLLMACSAFGVFSDAASGVFSDAASGFDSTAEGIFERSWPARRGAGAG